MKLQRIWMLPVLLLLAVGTPGYSGEPNEQEAAIAEIEKLGGGVEVDKSGLTIGVAYLPAPDVRPVKEELFFGVAIIVIIVSTFLCYSVRSRKILKIGWGLGCVLVGAIVMTLITLLSILCGI